MKDLTLSKAMMALALVTASSVGTSSAFAQGKEPLRIGVPTALSGPYGALGLEIRRAIEFGVAEANASGGVDGRKIEVQFLDTEGKPDLARKQAEKLTLEGYKVLTGTISSGELLAVAPMLERWDAVFVNDMGKSSKLTGDSCVPRLFQVTQGDAQDLAAMREWLAGRKEGSWSVMALDAVWGREISKSFRDAATASGKRILGEYYSTFGANDYAPYIQQIKASAPEAVFVVLAGRDLINFLTHAKQFGLMERTFIGGMMTTQDYNVKALGATAKGIWGAINYTATLDTPESKRFVAAWRSFYKGDDPTSLEGLQYMGFKVILQAVERTHSVKPTDLARAMSGGSFDTFFGKQTIRAADNQMLLPNHFGYVGEQEGKLRGVVAFTVPADKATPPPDGSCKMGKL